MAVDASILPARAPRAAGERRRRIAAAALCCCAWPIATLAADAAQADGASNWTFRVLLDGRPIGEHHYRITRSADGSADAVLSEASFTVHWLGITLYRYRHRAAERWRGNCLVALAADTDDNGQRTRVAASLQGDTFEVSAPAPLSVRGCVMSFAYWNPALRSQRRLLNAQTGGLESVTMVPIEEGSVESRGRPAGATGLRLGGLAQPITLWYSPSGDWLGLDTRVDGGRLLSYRLP